LPFDREQQNEPNLMNLAPGGPAAVKQFAT
jgi:hypothetical protein